MLTKKLQFYEEIDKSNIHVLYETFENNYAPRKNTCMRSVGFLTRKQSEGQNID